MKAYFTANLAERFKGEWIMREYGSYEDAGKPENHPVAIIERSPKNKIVAKDEAEYKALAASARHCSDHEESDPEARGYGTNSTLRRIF